MTSFLDSPLDFKSRSQVFKKHLWGQQNISIICHSWNDLLPFYLYDLYNFFLSASQSPNTFSKSWASGAHLKKVNWAKMLLLSTIFGKYLRTYLTVQISICIRIVDPKHDWNQRKTRVFFWRHVWFDVIYQSHTQVCLRASPLPASSGSKWCP